MRLLLCASSLKVNLFGTGACGMREIKTRMVRASFWAGSPMQARALALDVLELADAARFLPNLEKLHLGYNTDPCGCWRFCYVCLVAYDVGDREEELVWAELTLRRSFRYLLIEHQTVHALNWLKHCQVHIERWSKLSTPREEHFHIYNQLLDCMCLLRISGVPSHVKGR
jgi:hypothetical protein